MANTSSSVRDRKRDHGLGWVPWAALIALLALALLAFLLVRNLGDDGDAAGVDTTNDGNAAMSASEGAEKNGAGSGSTRGAVLTSDGVNVLDLATQGRLAEVNGQTVTANAVEVRSVVADEGFWVGDDQRGLFVHLSEGARASAGESQYQVRQGQRVDLTGTVKPVPSNVNTLGVTQEEGAEQLRNAGSYLDADSIRIR